MGAGPFRRGACHAAPGHATSSGWEYRPSTGSTVPLRDCRPCAGGAAAVQGVPSLCYEYRPVCRE
ncbi:hypothetical protein JCM4914_46180 [Streptomyces platensis subsp. malvinus]